MVGVISMLKVTKAVQRYLNGKLQRPPGDLTVFLGKLPIDFDDKMIIRYYLLRSITITPDAPCMEYLPTFGLFLG